MGHLDGAHTHGGDGSSLALPVTAAALFLGIAALLPVLLALLNALIIAAAFTVGLALTAGAAVLAWRLRRAPAAPPWQPGTLQASEHRAVAPREVHLHLHGASPADIAEALAQLPAALPAPQKASDFPRYEQGRPAPQPVPRCPDSP